MPVTAVAMRLTADRPKRAPNWLKKQLYEISDMSTTLLLLKGSKITTNAVHILSKRYSMYVRNIGFTQSIPRIHTCNILNYYQTALVNF